MPRNRKKRNRRNRRRIHKENMETLVHDGIKYQDHKRYLKEIEKQEIIVLNRTIFVSNVKNLNIPSNLENLKTFFKDQYGNVQECCVTSFGKKRNGSRVPPPAKLIFRSAHTASKIFGKPLEEVRKGDRTNASRLIPSCAAYYGGKTPGKLRVLPADAKPIYGPTVVYETQDLLSKTFVSSSISLGHWVPEDGGSSFLQLKSQDFPVDFIEEFNGFKRSNVVLDLRKRLLQIQIDASTSCFHNLTSEEKKFFTITFRLKELQSKIDLGCDNTQRNKQYCILFNCKDPPKLHHITINCEGYETKERVINIHSAPFDHCLGFKINLELSDIHQLVSRRDEFAKKLNNFGIINGISMGDVIPISCRRVMFSDEEKISIEHKLKGLRFTKIGLLVRSILDKGKFCSWWDALHDTTQERGDSLDMFQVIATADFCKARMVLELVSEMPRATRFPSKVLNMLLLEEYDTDMDKLDYCVELPRLVITPTRTIVSGLEIEMSNRVVRHFIMSGLHTTDFMRVTICDENGDRLSNDDFKSPEISVKFKEILLNGIIINGNKYKFLAYSSSQLKECSVWMVNCLSNHNLVQTIRTWMGDFSDIKTPSKYAARMGQCFSTTIQTLQGSSARSGSGYLRVNDKTTDIMSIESGKESCHSDGTGLIRKEAMEDILKNVPFGCIENVSIIQIRFGGAKGTLTAWDNLRALTHYDVCLRKSMIKFPSPYRHLEVIKVGKHVPYYLNRQMIMLLSVHDVPQLAFLTMQTAMLNKLDEMLISREIAAEILPQLSGPDSSIKSSLIHMLRSGFSPSSDPFLFSCLYAIRNHHLINLQKKSRIFVKKGAVLIGGLDETGEVPEGCVFVKVRCGASEYRSLTGPVLVAKHPVTHPGDVRMLLAVDIPRLQAHVNVILFSQYGKRAEADKMSGSDLDGDEFAVTWDNRLFLKDWNGCTPLGDETFQTRGGRQVKVTKHDISALVSSNYPPMDFDTQPKAAPISKILDEHLIDHFVEFAKADTLGRISMMWLDYAAKHRSAACSQCIELAKLHSIAVDYPKSGVPAIIPRELVIPSSKPRPHWREKKGESYHCCSTVGKLYDEIIKRSTKNEQMERHDAVAGRRFNKHGQLLCFRDETKVEENMFQTDVVEKLELFKTSENEGASGDGDGNIGQASECILFAIQQREIYEEEIIMLMNKYRVHSEGELLTGCISKYHRLNKRRRFDLAEEIRLQCRQLRDTSCTKFLTEVVTRVLPQSIINDAGMDYCISYARGAASSDTKKLGQTIDQLAREEGGSPPTDLGIGYEDVLSMRRFARKLAAAYYLVTYHPQIRRFGLEEEDVVKEDVLEVCLLSSSLTSPVTDLCWKGEGDSHSLFSFPHVVSDVIAVGLCEKVEVGMME